MPGTKRLENSLPVVVAGALLACLAGFFATARGQHPPATSAPSEQQAPLVDDRLLQTARRLFVLADTSEEQQLANEALRLSDHELDQAFATELRQAQSVPLPVTGPLEQLTARISTLKGRLQSYERRIAQLSSQAADDSHAGDELAVLKAQQALDQDELEDAQQDLTRQGGDRHALLERALQEHESIQHQPAPQARPSAADKGSTIFEQTGIWLDLNGRDHQIVAARNQAASRSSALLRQHENLEAHPQPSRSSTGSNGPDGTQAAVARLKLLSNQQKTLTEYDKRIQDCRQLGDIYGRWSTLVEARRSTALHSLLGSVAAVLAILLAVIFGNRAIGHAFRQTDRRRLHQLRTVSKLAVGLTGWAIILLIVFGPPTQMTTVIGLATAGLTVALKDFIVGFLGWFVLLGRNGIHLGDWVEIEGVGGEVIEIGLLRTVLLEVGNWAATGHPTGRRVAFLNSFAIEGHFFNFSTAGQWLWDQLEITLPSGGDAYRMADQIADVVNRETEAEVRQAEEDWQRVTSQYGIREFSAKPALELRPSTAGLQVAVRYITRAPQRYEVKARLYHRVVDLLRQPASVASTS